VSSQEEAEGHLFGFVKVFSLDLSRTFFLDLSRIILWICQGHFFGFVKDLSMTSAPNHDQAFEWPRRGRLRLKDFSSRCAVGVENQIFGFAKVLFNKTLTNPKNSYKLSLGI